MSEDLPEDTRRWPSDPYELLGTGPTSDRRELRLAYTQLIRRFKPEHAPEQFRRIREAYDSALARLEFLQRFGQFESEPEPASGGKLESADSAAEPEERAFETRSEPAPEPAAETAPEPAPEHFAESTSEPATAANRRYPPQRRSVADELDELWEQACIGEAAEIERAYRRICRLQRENPNESAIYVRLYWLLRLAPESDRERTAADWLLAGLARCSHVWVLRELCRREIDRDPNVAFRTDFKSLLAADPFDAAALEELLVARWDAAARLDRDQTVAADLNTLRRHWAQRHEALWGRLLVKGAERLIWTDEDTTWLTEEIDTLPHFQVNLVAEADHLDYLRTIAAECRKLRRTNTIPNRTVRRLLSIWQQQHLEANRQLLELAGELATKLPADVLRFFDHLQRYCPTLLAGVQKRLCLREVDESAEADERDAKALAEIVRDFLAQHPGPGYLALRERLLQFCLSEAIDPLRFASIVAPDPLLRFRQGQILSDAISWDTALRCAYAVHEMIWAGPS